MWSFVLPGIPESERRSYPTSEEIERMTGDERELAIRAKTLKEDNVVNNGTESERNMRARLCSYLGIPQDHPPPKK